MLLGQMEGGGSGIWERDREVQTCCRTTLELSMMDGRRRGDNLPAGRRLKFVQDVQCSCKYVSGVKTEDIPWHTVCINT